MNVLIVGEGGREHALAKAISTSIKCTRLYAAPGNPGISKFATCIELSSENNEAIIQECKRFNIDLSKRIKHNALLDCELLREVYINLLDVKEPKFDLSSNNLEKNVIINHSYNKKIVRISDSEIKQHKDFIKKELKKNFY